MDLNDLLNDELFLKKTTNEAREKAKEEKSALNKNQAMAKEIEALKLEMEVQRKVIKKLAYNHQRQPSSEWLDMKATQEFLQLAERTIYKYLKNGKLGCSKAFGKNYFKRSELEALLEKNYRKKQ